MGRGLLLLLLLFCFHFRVFLFVRLSICWFFETEPWLSLQTRLGYSDGIKGVHHQHTPMEETSALNREVSKDQERGRKRIEQRENGKGGERDGKRGCGIHPESFPGKCLSFLLFFLMFI